MNISFYSWRRVYIHVIKRIDVSDFLRDQCRDRWDCFGEEWVSWMFRFVRILLYISFPFSSVSFYTALVPYNGFHIKRRDVIQFGSRMRHFNQKMGKRMCLLCFSCSARTLNNNNTQLLVAHASMRSYRYKHTTNIRSYLSFYYRRILYTLNC